MNQASHYVDLLDWMIGPVKSINASIATIARNIEVEDTAALKIEWKNGALGTMAVTMITYPKNLEGSITILGDKGTVKIGGKAVNKIEYWESKSFNNRIRVCSSNKLTFHEKQKQQFIFQKLTYRSYLIVTIIFFFIYYDEDDTR